jgi:hypothetical protein
MLTRRAEALRRLGGPVCPVCETVGAENIEVRFLTNDGSEWLASRGKRAIERESLAPMCQQCFLLMENTATAKRAAEAERRAREDARAAADEKYLGSLGGGMEYREACAEHEDDLTAAEKMAEGWMGNGLFGNRGE